MDKNQISKSDFKTKALEYFRQVEASGESIIVTDHGKPVLEVRPYRDPARAPLDILRGSMVRYDDPTEPVAENDWDAAQ